MTRNDVLNDERIKRYSEGNPTPTDLAELCALAETEPLYAEALELFAPWSDEKFARILEHARLRVQLAELKDAVRVVMRAGLGHCSKCRSPVTFASLGGNFCDEHGMAMRAAGRMVFEVAHASVVRRLQALLADDELKGHKP